MLDCTRDVGVLRRSARPDGAMDMYRDLQRWLPTDYVSRLVPRSEVSPAAWSTIATSTALSFEASVGMRRLYDERGRAISLYDACFRQEWARTHLARVVGVVESAIERTFEQRRRGISQIYCVSRISVRSGSFLEIETLSDLASVLSRLEEPYHTQYILCCANLSNLSSLALSSVA